MNYDSARLYLDVLLREYELVVEKKTGLEQQAGMLLAGAFVVLGWIFDKVRLTEVAYEAVKAIECEGKVVTWDVLWYVLRVVVGTLAYVCMPVAMWRMCKVIDKSEETWPSLDMVTTDAMEKSYEQVVKRVASAYRVVVQEHVKRNSERARTLSGAIRWFLWAVIFCGVYLLAEWKKENEVWRKLITMAGLDGL